MNKRKWQGGKMNKAGKILTKIIATIAAVAVGMCSGTLAGNHPLHVQASGRPVAISSCLVSGENVICEIKSSSVPSSDDGKFYVYADEVYEDGPTGSIVAKVDAGTAVSASFPLNYNTAQSNLSRKFLIAVKRNGQMVQVSDEHYITNPEALAAHAPARMDRGIKGILPDITKVSGGQLEELGIQQIVYNMDVDEICSAQGVAGAVAYNYNGQTYYFSGSRLADYDATVKGFNNRGIQVTMVFLNGGRNPYASDLLHPLAREDGFSCPGYALNVAEAAGTNHLKAIAAFLAQRYDGTNGCGQVDNWIVGNEVNARTSWWYTNSTSLDFNVNIYVKAFRIVYNEMKSMNASVRIYNSIDQEWNRKSNPGSFLAKEYLDQFNYYINREGNIDWGLSYHPYNSPLYDPYAWNGPAVWVKNNLSTPYITMQNIDILINYMHQRQFLNPNGEVRSISLAEIGYTSSFGTSEQEASIAYGYLKAASLPDVDAFILFRQTDDAHEMESHLALGLYDLNGNKKPAFEIYKNLGTANEAAAKARASEIIGMDIDQMISQNIIWTRGGNGVVQ